MPSEENHLGEAIVHEDGTLEYLKTYRLSAAQTRRAYLLQQLALSGWKLADAAERLNATQDELVVRLRNAGFGYLLKAHVLEAATRRRARGR
jgi:transcriptional regulator with GAF, ATPase, and Fis domain